MTSPDDRAAHDVGLPVPVDVQIGEQWLRGLAHGTRIGRRGRQILISHKGRFVWVLAERVRPRTSDKPAP